MKLLLEKHRATFEFQSHVPYARVKNTNPYRRQNHVTHSIIQSRMGSFLDVFCRYNSRLFTGN